MYFMKTETEFVAPVEEMPREDASGRKWSYIVDLRTEKVQTIRKVVKM